jgi:type VI secretion system protein ImpA
MIDVEKLLEPLAGDSPVGPNVRFLAGDTTLDEIEEARREMDPVLDPDGRGKEADWRKARRLAERALAEHTKDLQVVSYLTEALARLEGFGSVADGLRLTRGLLERYWDRIHPGVEDGELITPLRARWISWMGSSREFLAAVKSIPITSGPGVDSRGWLDYEDSQRVDDAAMSGDPAVVKEMKRTGRISGTEWQSLMGATPTERLAELHAQVSACEKEARALDAFCSEKFPEDAPSLVELAGFLYDCRTYLEERVQGPGGDEDYGDSDFAEGGVPGAAATAHAGSGGPISSRDDAYRRLREAAEYLRRTEPHSPVPYLVERAINWGQMPFQEMLRDVLKDDKARNVILETLGMSE